jgi:hypothetical protein
MSAPLYTTHNSDPLANSSLVHNILFEKWLIVYFCFEFCYSWQVSNTYSLLRLQVFEVAPSLFMVELSKNNGDTIEYNHVSIYFYVHCFLQKHCSWCQSRQTIQPNRFFCIVNGCCDAIIADLCIDFIMVAVLQELVKGPERYSLESGRGRHSIRKLEHGGSTFQQVQFFMHSFCSSC